jgi:hypothetical protein
LIHLCCASLQKKTRLVPCGPYLQALVGQAASALSLACPTANHSKAIPFKARAAAFPLLLLARTKPFLTSFAGQIIETHGPYQHGSGFKTVNAPDPALQPFPANTPPAASNQSIGVSFPGHFASEFGCRYCFHSVSFVIPPLHLASPRHLFCKILSLCCSIPSHELHPNLPFELQRYVVL